MVELVYMQVSRYGDRCDRYIDCCNIQTGETGT